VRLTVEAERYRAWRRAAPGVVTAAGPGPADRPEVMPPFVAAAFAVHVQAERTLSLRMTGPAMRLSAHVSRAGSLAAAVVLARFGPHRSADRSTGREPDPGQEWVQIALVRGEQAAEEVLRWVPDERSGDPWGSLPDGAGLRIVASSGDLVRWIAVGGGWVEPDGARADRAGLADVVGTALAAQPVPAKPERHP